MSENNKKSKLIKKRMDLLKAEYDKYEQQINQIKKKQNLIIKQIITRADEKAIEKIKQSLN